MFFSSEGKQYRITVHTRIWSGGPAVRIGTDEDGNDRIELHRRGAWIPATWAEIDGYVVPLLEFLEGRRPEAVKHPSTEYGGS